MEIVDWEKTQRDRQMGGRCQKIKGGWVWYCYEWYGWLRKKKKPKHRLKESTVAEYGSKVTEWIIQRLLVLYFFSGLSSCHKTLKDRKQIVGSIKQGMKRLKRDRLDILWLSGMCHRRWTQLKRIWRAGLTSCQENERERHKQKAKRERERERGRERDRKKHKQTEGLSSGEADRPHSDLHPLAFCTDTGPLAPSDLYRCPQAHYTLRAKSRHHD